MAWNPETSSWELPPTNNITTPPPELFPPEIPPDGVCANTAQPGDLIEVIYPNDTQVIYRYVGAVEVCTESDVRAFNYDRWGKVTFMDSIYYPATLDTPTTETLIYAPPALSVPLPSGVSPEMVTDGMITGGEVDEWQGYYDPGMVPTIDGCPCVRAWEVEFRGVARRCCYHYENIEESESEWNALPPEPYTSMRNFKARRILSTYMMIITFPFPLERDEPTVVPVLASLALLAFLMGAAAGAGVAPTPQRRRHVSFE